MKSNKCCGFEIGKEVCAALGLDASNTRTIDIHIAADSLVVAKVEHILSHDQADKLMSVLTAYTLTRERDEATRPIEAGEDITPLGETLRQTAGA
jgi:hypothetical protein